jgi:YbbR domain-containing protein
MRLRREHKLKIISVILATTLWYFVVWGKPVEKVIEVPLFYRVNKPGYLIEMNPQSILVKLTGTRNSFRKLSEKILQITIDLSQYLPVNYEKVYRVRVPIEALNLPPEVKIKEVTPRYVTVIIKKLGLKRLPVKVKFINKKRGAKILVIPPQVIAKGPISLLNKIKYLDTGPIDFTTLEKVKELEVKINYPSDLVSVIPDRVKIVLEEKKQTKGEKHE